MIFYIAIISLYIIFYYIVAFNKFFEKGISLDILKKNTFIKQIILNFIVIIVFISALNAIKIQDTVYAKFLKTNDGTNLYGAGLTDITIKMFGYVVFSILLIICGIMIVKYFKQNNRKKIILWILYIPLYLLILFIVTVIFDFTFVKSNELDKQKKYIEYNIKYTKNAYNLDVKETEINNSGIITKEDLEENQDVINNINLLNNDVILSNLKEYQTNLGYYSFNSTKLGLYKINNNDTLIYVTPREIVNNETRTYNNKTYEYTHGFGIIATSVIRN